MQLWQDGLVAMLAAIGLASLMWAAVKTVLYTPTARRHQGAAALVPAQGDGELLEQQIRSLQRLRRDLGVFDRILVVDCGLSEEGVKLARLLVEEDRMAVLCTMDEIGGYLDG